MTSVTVNGDIHGLVAASWGRIDTRAHINVARILVDELLDA